MSVWHWLGKRAEEGEEGVSVPPQADSLPPKVVELDRRLEDDATGPLTPAPDEAREGQAARVDGLECADEARRVDEAQRVEEALRVEEAQRAEEVRQLQELAEERRIDAIEARTAMDAMEYHVASVRNDTARQDEQLRQLAAQLEAERRRLAERDGECERLAREVSRLQQELETAKRGRDPEERRRELEDAILAAKETEASLRESLAEREDQLAALELRANDLDKVEWLQAQLADAERELRDAAQRQQAVALQQAAELEKRERQVRADQTEIARLQDALAGERELNARLQQQVESFGTVEVQRPAVAAGAPLRLARAPERGEGEISKAASPAAPLDAPRGHGERITAVVHFEDAERYRSVVRDAAHACDLEYITAGEATAPSPSRTSRLAVNLLSGQVEALTGKTRVGEDRRDLSTIVYCADEGRGFCLGLVHLFPYPFDGEACVARLLAGSDAVQRLLVVSDQVDMVRALREMLAKLKCSTSVAFDARQALELLPMVRPDVLLVDATLPKGDGLRLLGRFRIGSRDSQQPSVSVLWGKPVDPREFRQAGIRAVRDFSLPDEDLARAVSQILGAGRWEEHVPERKAAV